MSVKLTGSLLFVVFAGLQLNDPDPIVWIVAYLFPVFCVWILSQSTPLLLVTGGYLVSAVFIFLYGEAAQHPREPVFEAGGLLLVACWLGLVVRGLATGRAEADK